MCGMSYTHVCVFFVYGSESGGVGRSSMPCLWISVSFLFQIPLSIRDEMYEVDVDIFLDCGEFWRKGRARP